MLGSASNHMCVRCNKPAEHWHHWNYQRKYWASVVPVCRKCHSMHHHRQLKIPLSSKDAVQGAEY
jgi:predicted HNH restriction endonuclease